LTIFFKDDIFNALIRFNLGGCSSAGRALAWHARGQEFDPPQLHHFYNNKFSSAEVVEDDVNLKIIAEVVEWHTRRSQKPIRATL
jgi:hypothetical protein